jgi:hypothetical protein
MPVFMYLHVPLFVWLIRLAYSFVGSDDRDDITPWYRPLCPLGCFDYML